MLNKLDTLKINNYELTLYVSGVRVFLAIELDGVLINRLKLATNATLSFSSKLSLGEEHTPGFDHICLSDHSNYTFLLPVDNLSLDEQHKLYKKLANFFRLYVSNIDKYEAK